MTKFQRELNAAKMGIGALIFWLVLLIACLIGWVINIVELIGMSNVLSGEGVVRIAGIFFPPLGAFMGFFF